MVADDGIPDLAATLNDLFARVPDANGNLYNNSSAARELTRKGYPVSPSYIGSMRSGRQNNPTARLLNGIAELFGVPISYFLGDEDEKARLKKQLDLLGLVRDSRVQSMATRLAGMSETSKDTVMNTIDALIGSLRKIDGLDNGNNPGKHDDNDPDKPSE